MITRGQVWEVALDPAKDAEIRKTRPCVVMSSDRVGDLPLKVIVPLTEWDDKYESSVWLVKIEPDQANGLTKSSAADTFQVKSVSIYRFSKLLGSLTSDQMADIAAAIGLVVEVP